MTFAEQGKLRALAVAESVRYADLPAPAAALTAPPRPTAMARPRQLQHSLMSPNRRNRRAHFVQA